MSRIINDVRSSGLTIGEVAIDHQVKRHIVEALLRNEREGVITIKSQAIVDFQRMNLIDKIRGHVLKVLESGRHVWSAEQVRKDMAG